MVAASEVTYPQAGFRVEVRTTPPGAVTFSATSDHLIRVHAGPPVSGACRLEPFVYQQGDIDLFPVGLSETWQEDGESTFLAMQVSPALLRRAAKDLGHDPDSAALDPRHLFRDPQIEHIGWALHAEQREGNPTGNVYAESLGLAMAMRLLRTGGATRTYAGGLTKRQLSRVTDYIEENLDRELSLTSLAAVAGVSASHLKACFRRQMGTPVHRYIIQRRVDRAKALLLRGGIPVSQVALHAGFSHQSHLARWMRRLHGITPSALMQSCRVAGS